MHWWRTLLLLTGIVFSLPVLASCEVTDDAGHHLKLPHPAKRIVVLAPDLVEDMFAIGAGSQVIAVVKGSDYPRAANKILQVGSYSGIDLERIVTLKPDLIIAWKYGFTRQIAVLRELGFPVYISAPSKLEDVPHLLQQLGCLTGKTASADAAAREFEQSISQLAAVKRKPLKVFFQIDTYTLQTINQDSWINQVLALCGGQNVFADANIIAPVVSREAVFVANPDVILNDSTNDSWKKTWQSWPEIQAVKSQHLYTVTPDLIARAGPRLVKGARQVCDYLDAARKG